MAYQTALFGSDRRSDRGSDLVLSLRSPGADLDVQVMDARNGHRSPERRYVGARDHGIGGVSTPGRRTPGADSTDPTERVQ